MVNTELETEKMSVNTETISKSPEEYSPNASPLKAKESTATIEPEQTTETTNVNGVSPTEETGKTCQNGIDTTPDSEVKTEEDKPSNTTPSLPDASYKRIQSTFGAVNSKVVYLVHWENTVHSGAVLASILAFLVLTAYHSLVNLLCGLALLTIGADWLWVLGFKQFKTVFNQKADNPHEKYLQNPPQIRREDLDQYVDVWVDIINVSLIEATKIVLIANPLRSMKYVGILYISWTILSWFSFRTIIAFAVITAFAVPKLYKQNQKLVDQHLEKAQVLAKDYIDRGVDVVGKNTGNLIPMAQKFAASKGWIANPDATKKQA